MAQLALDSSLHPTFPENQVLLTKLINFIGLKLSRLHRLPWFHPLSSCVPSQSWPIEVLWVVLEFLRSFQALLHGLDVLDHHTVTVFLENGVVDVVCCGLAVREVDRSDFYKVLYLPQAGVVFWDVLDHCEVGLLKIKPMNCDVLEAIESHSPPLFPSRAEFFAPNADFL